MSDSVWAGVFRRDLGQIKKAFSHSWYEEYKRLRESYQLSWDTKLSDPCYSFNKERKVARNPLVKAWWPRAISAQPLPRRSIRLGFRCDGKYEIALVSSPHITSLHAELKEKAKYKSFDEYYHLLSGDAACFTLCSVR